MKSIRWKLVIMYIALVFLVMTSSGTFIIYRTRNNEIKKVRDDLESAAVMIVDKLISANSDNPSEFRKWFSANLSYDSIIYNIIDSGGQTIATSEANDDDILFQPYPRSSVMSALNGNEEFSIGRKYPTSYNSEIRWAEYAMPYLNEDKTSVLYVIYVCKDAAYIYENSYQITQTIGLTLFLALAATVFIGLLFANSLTVPISILTKKAKEFAVGNFVHEIEVASMDEIGQLTASFNNMAKELTGTMSEMTREKSKMEIVLFNMTDGVLAYDNNGSIIHYNNVCLDFLDFKDVGQLTFTQMLERLGIYIPETGTLTDEHLQDTTIFINERYLNATFNPYKNNDGEIEGIIIVLQDITKHKKLDNMRKEFVANVSHEIRTPLTTIKSYSETLIDGAINDQKTAMDFLNVINSETDRMMFIVNDLLELSRLDNNRMDLQLRETDLIKLVEKNVNHHKITAEKQNKQIEFYTLLTNAVVTIDPDRINQVINNIISNSFKYSAENAFVRVHIEDSENYYRVYVQDTGMGIPKEDLRRIFERFYRVDKARSRAMGGTGLGLSIAKEIMEAHGGKINAVSEFGKGTTMILRFPKQYGNTIDDLHDEP